jgi:uncharacterized cofD-like protein
MKKRASTSRRTPWWRRRLGTAWPLIRHGATALLGLVVLVLGVTITFRTILGPLVGELILIYQVQGQQIFGEDNIEVVTHILGGILLFAGGWLLYKGVRRSARALFDTLNPRSAVTGVVDTYRRRLQLAQGPKIVSIGGGTGLSTLLRGLKVHSSNITAIVCVSDDGGSSGRIVQELGQLPPGDLRACLVALADAEKLMTDLFQYRFAGTGGGLSGHSLGNLLLAGLVDQAAGDLDEAIKLASEVLNVRGRVIPATKSHIRLRAIMEDDSEIVGETAIADSHLKIRRLFLQPEKTEPHPEALKAIAEADIIVIGPGSVYTSVIPNLLVDGIAEQIAKADCPKVYICNVMTQPGESESYTATEHVVAIEANLPCRVFDYVLVNTGLPSPQILERYRHSRQEYVVPDTDRLRHMGLKVVTGNFMSETDTVRHDPFSLASKLMDLIRY